MESRDTDELIVWAQALEAYARDWDETFEKRPGYFTQEFWYLLVGCMIANWNGRPMTMSQACQQMKSGSNRTREERIKRAVDDGFLVKERTGDDGRTALVRPTPKLEALMVGHLRRPARSSGRRSTEARLGAVFADSFARNSSLVGRAAS